MNQNKVKESLTAAEKAAQEVVDKASRMAADAKDLTAEAVEGAKDAGADVLRTIKAQAADTFDQAEKGFDGLKGAADVTMAKVKTTLADSGDRLANALRDAAEGSRHASEQVLGAVAGGVSEMSDRLRGNSLTDLVSTTKAFARRNPGAFAAGAAIAGFALARFMQASARRGPRG